MIECQCGSKNNLVLYKNLTDKSYFVEGKFLLLKCNDCGLEFLHPKLTEEQLVKYYPADKYYSFYDYNPLALKYHRISAFYWSKKSRFAGFFLSPFESLLCTYHIEPGNSVLEIGCGNGLKLEIYKKYGLKTAGIEPYGPNLTKKEKSLGIKRQSVKDTKFDKDSFDIIILKEVLEHVPDQSIILNACKKWLKPGGKVIITVPNVNSLWRRVFKENWFGYDAPRHLFNYNAENLAMVLKEHGLKVRKVRTYDTPYMLDGSIKFYIVSKLGKDSVIKKIVYSNFTKIALVPMSLVASKIGNGSLLEIECTKQ